MCDVFAVKVYGITSAGGGAPQRRQLEQKVMLANSVAQSFMSADNVNSRGQRMFLLRRQNSEKWTTSGPDPLPNDVSDRGDGGAWPQRAPAAASRQQYAIGQPPQGYPPPIRAQPQHHMMSGPRPARSISVEGPTPSRQGQIMPRMAAPGPRQQGFLKGPAAPQYHQGQVPPRTGAPLPQGYLLPTGPPGPVPGVPVAQVRTRSDSFGSVQPALRSADWQSSMTEQRGVVESRDWSLSGGHQPPQHWPAPSSSSSPYMQRQAAYSHYGISDL